MSIRRKIGRLKREIGARRRRGGDLTKETHGRLWLPTIATNGGIGIELGVASGYFSNAILQNSPLNHLYSIDCWGDHHNAAEYLECCRLLRMHGERSIVLRMYFEEAIDLFENEFFDFIYVDAYAGTGQDGGSILRQWWPKVKSGGIYAGHDYDPNWPQTVEAVDTFCSEVGRDINAVPGVSGGHKHDAYGSWFIVK